jgi:N-acetylglucosaminyldiphosphoundecaprenol N-acetyl-beta-D-mannosaminyltransferase
LWKIVFSYDKQYNHLSGSLIKMVFLSGQTASAARQNKPLFSRSPVVQVYEAPVSADDLSRPVYGLLGMPIDASDRSSVLERMLAAVVDGKPFLLSTPNVNFMMESERDAEFRESLLSSDLCCVDGMPIVWLAQLFGIPVTQRVSGSDLFDTIRSKCDRSRPIKVFLFGGREGVAETVNQLLNAQPSGMRCVGWINPGFGTVEEMSAPHVIQQINESNADLLAVFLSAKKAQSWLMLNHNRLSVPVRGQFGATINYQAGAVRRAPIFVQRLGFEWLWRIKEEPYLWRRYWNDGLALGRLTITRGIPIALGLAWRRYFQNSGELSFNKYDRDGLTVVCLVGRATKETVTKSIPIFESLVSEDRDVAIDISQIKSIDPRYFGLLLMLRKKIQEKGRVLKFKGVSKKSARMFRFNGFGFLLEPDVDLTFGRTP